MRFNSSIKVLVSMLLGTILEWYDFSLFASMSPLIAKVFFPAVSPSLSLIAAFSVFASGFLMRPLGALIFGHIGDRKGRRYALAITVWLMAIPTAIICFLPGYYSLGLLAPVILVVCRLLQGLAASGEYPGAMCYLAELAPDRQKGLWSSISMMGVAGGLLLGSLVNALLSYLLSEQQMLSWGWRIPFVLALPLALLAWYIRYRLIDSPVFVMAKNNMQQQALPVVNLFRQHGRNVLTGILLFALSTISFYLSFVYIVSYLVSLNKISMSEAMLINSISTLCMLILIPVFGWLSDKTGRKALLYAGAAYILVTIYPVYYLFLADVHHGLLYGQLILVVGIAMFAGPLSAMIVDMFSTLTRYTGVALSLNIGGSLFGGTCPLIAALLVEYSGYNIMPVIYPMSLSLLVIYILYKDNSDSLTPEACHLTA